MLYVLVACFRMEMQDLEEFREALELMEVPDLTLPDTGRPSAAFRQLVPFVFCHDEAMHD